MSHFKPFEESKECPMCGNKTIDIDFIDTYENYRTRRREDALKYLHCKCLVCKYSYDTDTKQADKEQN